MHFVFCIKQDLDNTCEISVKDISVKWWLCESECSNSCAGGRIHLWTMSYGVGWQWFSRVFITHFTIVRDCVS